MVLWCWYSIPSHEKFCLFKLGSASVGFFLGGGRGGEGWLGVGGLVGWIFLSVWSYCQAVVNLASLYVCSMSFILFCSWVS